MYTVGHSHQEPEAFLALLRQHRIATLIDVRSAPFSRYVPHFNQPVLQGWLDRAGVRYVWLGDSLGGRPQDPACYRGGVVRPGNVDYVAMACQPWYQAGIVRLLAEGERSVAAIMCSEEDPRRCHRHRLIEPSLREHGVIVQHIRGDGTVETIDPGETPAVSAPSPQLALRGFGA
jgi:uncharacterized protein (DUF488 family)